MHVSVVVLLGAAIVGVVAATRDAGSRDSVPVATDGVHGNWTVGPYVLDASTTIGSAGGVLQVAEGELAGLTLTVPSGALADGTTATVEHASILAHTWGTAVRPVTPAIRIEIGSEYAERLLTVSVPLDLSAGELAMGLYVADDGTLEGMPLAGGDQRMLDVSTRHFSTWFVSKYLPSELPDEIYTGYQMARDNWQFVNNGSFVEPGGICAGMVLSSAWYYLEQFKGVEGAAPLYNQFDYPHGPSTTGFQLDDAHAYRFASMVQADMSGWTGDWATSFREARYTAAQNWQFHAFRYAMYLTGEPQYVTMANWSRGGHAVLAYGATMGERLVQQANSSVWHAGGELWIADPNYPRQLNSITFDAETNEFVPYSTALRADGDPDAFPYIGYGAKSAFANWPQIAMRYSQMLDGTIGAGMFPSVIVYQWIVDPATGAGNWYPTSNPVADPDGTVTLGFTVTGLQVGARIEAFVFEPAATAYLDDSKATAVDSSGTGTVTKVAVVSPGLAGHTYKVVVMAEAPADAQGTLEMSWVDAIPLEVAAAPPPTTVATVPPTDAPTVPPTVPTTPPPQVPTTLYPCPEQCPPGILGVECSLHCGSISE